MVKLLLDNGADPNYAFFNNGGEKLSILTHAAVYQRDEVVKLLLDKGADPNYVIFKSDGSEESLLDVVLDASFSFRFHIEVAKLLLDYGAESKIGLDKFLPRAINESNKELILLLVNNGVDANQKTEFGRWFSIGPFKSSMFAHAVIHLEDEDLIKLLLDKEADPNVSLTDYRGNNVSLVYFLIANSENYDAVVPVENQLAPGQPDQDEQRQQEAFQGEFNPNQTQSQYDDVDASPAPPRQPSNPYWDEDDSPGSGGGTVNLPGPPMKWRIPGTTPDVPLAPDDSQGCSGRGWRLCIEYVTVPWPWSCPAPPPLCRARAHVVPGCWYPARLGCARWMAEQTCPSPFRPTTLTWTPDSATILLGKLSSSGLPPTSRQNPRCSSGWSWRMSVQPPGWN